MFIIGTAGHVDHGKTLLIKALTGIDTDRLPEEKKRGLTIDLGFAHFSSGSGADSHEIGVVDVPGHERFIRNMVAGAWGIDLALLVIAADDGWMYQTGNHLRVLTAMGISNIIITVTKTDMVSSERVLEVIDDAEVRLYELTGVSAPSAAVSAINGNGIEELRSLIIKQLDQTEAVNNTPLLWIDRSFGIKGAGLVVTGSLREGPVVTNSTLRLLPQNTKVRIRGIQSYDTETDAAVPASRTALNLSGISAGDVKRGNCLTTVDSDFSAETEFILKMQGDFSLVRNHSEAEFATGTAHSTGIIHFLKNSEGIITLARIMTEQALPIRFGQPVVIIRKGGSRITGSGVVLWKGLTDRYERLRLADTAVIEKNAVQLAVKGFVQDGGSWLFSNDRQQKTETQLLDLASNTGGIKFEELYGKISLPETAVKYLVEKLQKDGQLSERSGILFNSKTSATELSQTAKQIIAETKKAGKTGLDLNKVKLPGAQKELRILTRAGLIIPLSENLFLTPDIFNELVLSVLNGLLSGDTFDIAHAKNQTGLSRKYIIPLLNKMEEAGMVEREENLRRVK